MTSRMTRQLLQAKVPIPGEEDKTLPKFLKTSSTQSALEIENMSKFLTWHLFKGGVRTELIDKLHGSRVFDDTLKRLEI